MIRWIHRLIAHRDPYWHGHYTLRHNRWTCWCGFQMPQEIEDRISRIA